MSKRNESYRDKRRRKEQSEYNLCVFGMFVMIGTVVFPFAFMFADPAPFVILNGIVIAIVSKWIADCLTL